MPNNPARFKAGYSPVVGGERKMKRREYTTSVRATNRIRSITDLGAVNGGPTAVAVSTPSAETPFDPAIDRYGSFPGL